MEREIFKKGSTTYYWSSKFFPKSVRQDVFDLYSFVRLADDYVDGVPADSDGFYRLRRMWLDANKNMVFNTHKLPDDSQDLRAIKNIVRLVEQRGIKKMWVESFLDAMQSDLIFRPKNTLDDSLKYAYGSAEVVGLMMTKTMQLDSRSDSTQLHFDAEQGDREERTETYRQYVEGAPQRGNAVQREKPQSKGSFADFEAEVMHCARVQGRAMQWLNFIRDIAEDNQMGRQYFPVEELQRFSLQDLSKETASNQPEDFQKFIQFQIDRYKSWQHEAEAGYQYIPKQLLVPLKTAAGMYLWTAQQIEKDPLIVYRKKVKPSKIRIIVSALTKMV